MRFASLFLLFAGVPAFAADPAKPNIIVILADDLGYGDVSCNGAKRIRTPNIDKLAAEGRNFSGGYCSAATCTPTRYSLITGTYAFRVPGTGVAPPNAPALIKPGTATVASILKGAGYATAVVGKWHLGLGKEAPDWNGDIAPGPLEIGFDHCLLLPTTNDRVPQVYVEDHKVRGLDPKDPLWVGNAKPSPDFPDGITNRKDLRMDWSQGHNQSIHNGIGRIGFYTGGAKARFRDEDLADEWVNHSVKWIEKNKEKPFFLYFASHDIHVPRMPHERFQKQSVMGPRGDAILEFDWQVGELMKALDRLKLAENTLVIVTSDNGPVLDDGYKDQAVEKLGDHKPAGPFRGGKYTVFEGGTRVPFIARWKGKIPPGTASGEMISTVDFAASFAALTGVALPEKQCLDSFNAMPALLGEAGAKGREYLLQQDNNGINFGIRTSDWKLLRQKPAKAKGEIGGEKLFDLKADPGESTDVTAKHPEIVKQLHDRLDKIIADGRSRP